ncbi:hypothetical protein Tco_0725719 [Tanacetum coccineum]|uniref:Monodehydroascorbate reductase n=1 Tax=Tanacetum coccineum TaxID=301880 RepID=A0ABQ4YDN4_9ASTR
MEILIADQIALDDALVAPADRLKIGKCNLRLSLDVTSKEATLQLVYDVLKLTPFYKAFQVSADVPEIYIDILQICPKVGNKKFEEPPLEKEILAFLASLGHSGEIRKITDVNVNKLHQPWRSFAAVINKCLSGKPSYDSLRLSQDQILWGMYNKKKVDYAYLMWEDFIYQIENKNSKKGNTIYYPRFTKLVVNFVMDKDPSIPRRNKNEDTKLYGTILPVALTNEDIRNSESYKEYYAIASGMIPPKMKGSKKKANTDTTSKQKPPIVPKEKKSGKGKQKAKQLETISKEMMTEAEQLKTITKRSHKETHNSHASRSGADEGTGVSPIFLHESNELMEISIADQIALDDALVAPADRLKIGKCNLRLSSDVTSKEATLQVAYDVLKLTPFYKAFQVSADVPEIYMQEYWALLIDILQIFPKVDNKKFKEPPLEKEILAFLASLGHSREIRKITDVNVNKLHQPWRSFAAIINKCLSGKPSYDSLRLSQAQILWGMYNKKNVDYAYLLWEDFIYQIENKNTKKGNAMYYPRFTKLVVNFVMDKDPSIPRRNKVNWHYARDDPMFTTINVISRNEDTQLYGTILPVALTNEDIRNSESYKEYYAIASGTIPPKIKGSKKKADTDTTTKQKPPTVPKEMKEKKSGKGKQKAKQLETISEAMMTEAEQLKIITKRSRKETHSSHASGSGADEGTGVSPGVPDAPDYDSDDVISWKSSEDDQADDKNDDDENAQDDEDDDKDIDDENAQDDDDDEAQTESEDDGDDFIHPKLTTHDDETTHEEETDEDDTFDPIVHTPSHVSSSDDEESDNDVEGVDAEGEKSDEETAYVADQGNEAYKDTNANLEGRDDVMTDVILPQVQATQEIEDTHVTLTPVNPDGQQQSSSVSSGFEAVDIAVQLKYDKIREESHTENQQFLDSIDEGMKKVIKEQVKKEVSKITPKIEKLVNEQLKYEVLVRSLKEAKTSHAVVANLSELELKKILYDKMEANNSINRPRDGADDDQEPSAGTDRGSKRRRLGKEPESTSAPRETITMTAGKTITGSKTHKQSASQSAPVEETMQSTDVFKAPAHQEFETGIHDEQAEEEVHHLPDWFQQPKRLPSPDHAWNKSVPAVHESVQPWLSNLARRQDPRESFDELTDTTFDFSAFVMNRLNVKTLTPELLAARDVYSKRRIIAVTKVEIVEWQNYKHLDWITVSRDDDILYKFKEGDFHRIRIQDIEDMLLLLVQGKLTNLNVEERIAFNVSLRMFTRSVVI